jgi:hypothetical protein
MFCMHAALAIILEQIRGIWRFRWTAMLVALIVCLIGWLLVLALPETYSAWARVRIDTRLSEVPKESPSARHCSADRSLRKSRAAPCRLATAIDSFGTLSRRAAGGGRRSATKRAATVQRRAGGD